VTEREYEGSPEEYEDWKAAREEPRTFTGIEVRKMSEWAYHEIERLRLKRAALLKLARFAGLLLSVKDFERLDPDVFRAAVGAGALVDEAGLHDTDCPSCRGDGQVCHVIAPDVAEVLKELKDGPEHERPGATESVGEL
jgi:hypothetical protein